MSDLCNILQKRSVETPNQLSFVWVSDDGCRFVESMTYAQLWN